MKKSVRKKGAYLAGAMECLDDLGEEWRIGLMPFLKELGFNVLNPVDFEPKQLEGAHTNRLPKIMAIRDKVRLPRRLKVIKRDADGVRYIKPTHWHHLKYGLYKSYHYKRFCRYMEKIIFYDIHLVKKKIGCIICNWTQETANGAGTHGELTVAKVDTKVPIYLVCDPRLDYPGWIHGCKHKVFDDFKSLKRFLKRKYGKKR